MKTPPPHAAPASQPPAAPPGRGASYHLRGCILLLAALELSRQGKPLTLLKRGQTISAHRKPRHS